MIYTTEFVAVASAEVNSRALQGESGICLDEPHSQGPSSLAGGGTSEVAKLKAHN